jgi:hypothetical protein
MGSLNYIIGCLPVTLCTKSLTECPVYNELLKTNLLPIVERPDDFYHNHLRTFYSIPVYFPSSYGEVLVRQKSKDFSEMCKKCQER